MLVTFFCDHCDAKLRINADAMGTDLECPECENILKVPVMRLGPGFVVGGFLIKHKLGEGGMGEVYVATQLSLERDIALKILPSRFTRDNSFVVRFLKEVHYQAKMDHPNIVTAYDAGEDNGVYFMAMAYVPGETLEERLDRDGTLKEKDALYVIRQVAQALEYAYGEKGILHRDIKPANIMLTTNMNAKVLDMGLSKNTFEKNSTTLADTLMGTPNYMSPEQIDHPQDLDSRSDMFSLGMTFYHMLTGQIPFDDSGFLKTLKRHAHEKLEDPRNLIPGISQSVAHLLARMLAREPDDRYEDWKSFLDDLNMVTQGKGIPTAPEGESTLDLNPPPAPEKPAEKPPIRRHSIPPPSKRSPAGIMISVVAGLGLGLTGFIIMANRMGTPSTPIISQQRPVPTPAPTAKPRPTAVPTLPSAEMADLQKELTTIILNYERNRDQHDEVIRQLSDLGLKGSGSPVSDKAAEHIVRIRRDRDEALEQTRNRFRKETIRILEEYGPVAARQYLNDYTGPFQNELTEQIANLGRRITIWEKEARTQKEAEKTAAGIGMDSLRKQLAPLVINREWPQAMLTLQEAAENPLLFPASEEITTLRSEVIALQSVPELILASYSSQLNQDIPLKLIDRDLFVQIKEVKVDGLLVSRTVFLDDGTPVGTAELFIPFASLSREEIEIQLELLEGSELLIYKALLAHRNGDREACRTHLENANTPLALALRDELFALPTLQNPFISEWTDPPSPINTPRFAPLPKIESP
ncbi:protein kinase [Kiritimatiellota bacterium B12222]|nr:protein kinase [Kiritimatiellota bacterium B12222]